ncbi:MAG: glutamine synthetase III [Phycisphaerae bacterium]|nr:glutamine synthetase III [Phycisphaerae bacterium]
MTFQNARTRAIEAIAVDAGPKATVDNPRQPVTEVFGQNVFSLSVMQAHLPKDVFARLLRTIRSHETLDPTVADVVANAMKDWAIARGATHYTHWFHPLTGATAEKHDAFLSPTDSGHAIYEFSGKRLIQGEPDASSFPSGGIRSTFEARGYTAWDPTSPAFLIEGVNGATLCIPTAFCSFTGHALDKKTPLLRSIEALSRQAVRVLRLFGNSTANHVMTTVGPEQEYFLIDRRFYLARPDLINAGRTLFGAKPPKGQEMEDHYFGSIKERVLAFMMDSERELYKLGIPIKTRHNEVAPAQFEIAPVFEPSNVAADHNQLVMETLRKVAARHGLHCILHEKPFAGINGSGKHNNWSLMDDAGNNLLDPGETPHENAQFLVFLTAVVRAIWKHGKLLRAAIATAGNDHRLGANEAPPAIISVYLGEKLTEVVQGIISGRREAGRTGGHLEVGVQALPRLPKDSSDRNRTSPFAFTGNKFEFRAVGSSASIARPNTFLNTIIAESLDALATEIEKAKLTTDFNSAVQKVLTETLRECEPIIFNGDNYSKEWHAEAERRGIPNLRTCVDALPVQLEPATRELFRKHGVYSEEELKSNFTIMVENYCKTLNIEALLTSDIARTMLLPACLRYQADVARTIAETKSVGSVPQAGQEKLLAELVEKVSRLKTAIDDLDARRARPDAESHDEQKRAKYYRDEVIPAMTAVRTVADELEMIVDDRYWPLPKYREMLFVY